MRVLGLVTGLCVIVGASGCLPVDLLTDPCRSDAAVTQNLLPGDTTVKLGSQYKPTFRMSTCGSAPQEVSTAWVSEDTTVIRIDPATGVLNAIGLGRSKLSAQPTPGGALFPAGIVTVVR